MGSSGIERLVKECRRRAASRLTQNVANTMGFATLPKIKLLWQLDGDRPVNAVAATATLFSKMLCKILSNIRTVLLSNIKAFVNKS